MYRALEDRAGYGYHNLKQLPQLGRMWGAEAVLLARVAEIHDA